MSAFDHEAARRRAEEREAIVRDARVCFEHLIAGKSPEVAAVIRMTAALNLLQAAAPAGFLSGLSMDDKTRMDRCIALAQQSFQRQGSCPEERKVMLCALGKIFLTDAMKPTEQALAALERERFVISMAEQTVRSVSLFPST